MLISDYNFGRVSIVVISLLLSTFLSPNMTYACMTASGIAHNGHVWTANNEDGPFGVANFINVFPKSGTNLYGYYTMTYLSPRYALTGAIQGGMNEAGLSFDFDAIPFIKDFDPKSRRPFPEGNDAILPYILGNMKTVNDVIKFFETYWFVDGFRDAQMHVSDKNGRFAIISASGIKLAKAGEFLVSTNFDVSGDGDSSSCWRYLIAVKKLSAVGASLKTMEDICKQTAQKTGSTMYSNIQNLTTGDIWFFSKHDPKTMLRTNIAEMILKGQKSYTFSDLQSLKVERPKHIWKIPKEVDFTQTIIEDYLGNYKHSYIGDVLVKYLGNSIEVSFSDGTKEILNLDKNGNFFHSDYDLYVKFEIGAESDRPEMSFFENGLWSLTVEKPEVIEQNIRKEK